jgi:hypothetical protein
VGLTIDCFLSRPGGRLKLGLDGKLKLGRQRTLLNGLKRRFPRLRRYSEYSTRVLFLQIWKDLPEDCYINLTYLHLEAPPNNGRTILFGPKLLLPLLRALSLKFWDLSGILGHIEVPDLEKQRAIT